ncbi:MAG: hypothetical protein Q4A01_03085 [Coriobacteriales bacterium]|nr:hypothetical protein [Coriobacteriales bacterium]
MKKATGTRLLASWMLATCMVVSCIPATAIAEEIVASDAATQMTAEEPGNATQDGLGETTQQDPQLTAPTAEEVPEAENTTPAQTPSQTEDSQVVEGKPGTEGLKSDEVTVVEQSTNESEVIVEDEATANATKDANEKANALTTQSNPTGDAKALETQAATPHISYRTHVQRVGWQDWRTDGNTSGTSGRSLRLEGINIKLSDLPCAGGIRYRTHVQKIGWQDWRADGAMAGTSHQSKRLEAIQVSLYGDMANRYDVYYRVHCQRFGWMGWAKNGEQSGSAGYSYRLEAIQICLVPKGGAAPGSTEGAFRQKAAKKTAKKAAKSSNESVLYENDEFKITVPANLKGKLFVKKNGGSYLNVYHKDYKNNRGGYYYCGAVVSSNSKMSGGKYIKYVGKSSKGHYIYCVDDSSMIFATYKGNSGNRASVVVK